MVDNDPIVYIVEDDPAARDSVAAFVSTMGLACRTFASAEEFLEHTMPTGPAARSSICV